MPSQFTFYFENETFPNVFDNVNNVDEHLSNNELVINKKVNLEEYYVIFDLNLSYYPAKIIRYMYILGNCEGQFLVGHYNKESNKENNDITKIETTVDLLSKEDISQYIKENFLDSGGDPTLNNILQTHIDTFYRWVQKENLNQHLSNSHDNIRKQKI